MSSPQQRDRVETNALLLGQAIWLLGKAHLRMIMLGDITGALTINRIIEAIDTERRRWLRLVNSPLS